ncbi:MAG: hypothetical protein IAE80_17525 [Anaerolinea sp.]|nr:hypothetical protein [Anaerolinea sp.]
MTTKKRRNWRPALGCLVVVVAIVTCSVGSVVGFNAVCSAYLPQRLPVYPDSEITQRTHNFIQEWGMGITTMVLYSPDDSNTVRSWYGVHTGTFLRESIENPTPITYLGRQIARVDFSIATDESGVGTQIILFGTCLN